MDVLRIDNRCNQNCLFCGADPKNLGDYAFDWPTIRERLATATADQLIEVSGGEPTLSKNLPRVLMWARQNKRRISLQSNAMRFSQKKFAAYLVKAGMTDAFISLHAPVAKQSDAITRTAGGFDLTVKGILNLLELNVHVSLNMVICTLNENVIEDYVRFVHQTFGKNRAIVFSYINPFHNAWRHRKLIPPISRVIPSLRRALVLADKLELDPHIPDICGLPICFFQGLEQFTDKQQALREGWPYKPHQDKIQGPSCASCAYRAKCDGHWKRYADCFGFDELIPVPEKNTPR